MLPPRLQVPRPQPYSFMDFALAYALRNVFGQESGPENQSFMCAPALSLPSEALQTLIELYPGNDMLTSASQLAVLE